MILSAFSCLGILTFCGSAAFINCADEDDDARRKALVLQTYNLSSILVIRIRFKSKHEKEKKIEDEEIKVQGLIADIEQFCYSPITLETFPIPLPPSKFLVL